MIAPAKNGDYFTSERARQADYMRRKRAEARDVYLPKIPPNNKRRRTRLLKDPYKFLKHYFPEQFYNDWTPTHREMIDAIVHAARFGGLQAIAAPRGEGKSTIVRCIVIWAVLSGTLRFPFIVAATGNKAAEMLRNIKVEFRNNERLYEDFTHLCTVIRYVAKAPARANAVTVHGGEEVNMVWQADHVIFPKIKGEPGSGGVLSATGITADDIRGTNVEGRRPDLVILDDIDNRESAESETLTKKRIDTIEQDVAGLAGQGKRMASVMLCTVINRKCCAYIYTDRKLKPSWRGQRHKLLAKFPDREDLWEKYQKLRMDGMEQGDNGQAAREFYVDNRKLMDAGAEVTNPNRHIAEHNEHGEPIQLSTLQFCYDWMCDKSLDGEDGWRHFATEYQNDPPEEDSEKPVGSGLTAHRVRKQLSGYPRGIVPDSCTYLVAAVDVGSRNLHWVASAWRSNATGFVIDYGVADVYPSKSGVEHAILSSLHTLREVWLSDPYVDVDGQRREIDLCLVDAGEWTSTIYTFCREMGEPFMPSIGAGGDSGRMRPFRMPETNTKKRVVGERWYSTFDEPNGVWRYTLDSDYWKQWVHERFLTPAERPGSVTLFSDADFRVHNHFSHQIMAEERKEAFVQGKGIKRFWDKKRKANHFFDATYYCCAGASIMGAKLVAPPEPGQQPGSRVRVNLRSHDGRQFFIGAR